MKPKRTYDAKQLAAVKKTCTVCAREMFTTRPDDPFVCLPCLRDQERAK